MQSNTVKAILGQLGLATIVLLTANAAALAGTVNLTAAPAVAALSDGQTVPMWGYTCGGAVDATCAASNPNAGGNWSPVIITVAQGQLIINLTNSLPLPPDAAAGIPTSLVIVGQLGGGLGEDPTRTDSPTTGTHAPQGTTWPGTQQPPGACGDEGTFCPPAQGPRVQSFGTEVARGATTQLTWDDLKPGTYLIESGTHPSIQGPMGLYGVLVVTAPDAGANHQAYPGVPYGSDVTLLLSEIDPVLNAAVAQAVATSGFDETAVWSGLTIEGVKQCGDPTVHTCYPPAVNYSPSYYLVNGVSFNRSTRENSRFKFASPGAGQVLVRFVNAGLRMHTPSIVGAQTGTVSGVSLVAEDGNVLPGTRRVQSEVLLVAGKTYDVLIDAPTAGPLAVFDRQLSLSTNNQRDGGMQAYIDVASGSVLAATAAVANPDSYAVVAGNTLSVLERSRGVLANDVGIYGVKVSGSAPAGLTLNPNGTFTYTGAPGSFTYCGNGATSGTACTTVTLADCAAITGCMGGPPTANADSYARNIASRLQVTPPGVLGNDIDPTGLPLQVDLTSVVASPGLTLDVNADGSFIASTATPGTHSFTYNAKNSQNTVSVTPATVTLIFPTPTGLTVNVRDAKTEESVEDYRWIIEEDRTVNIDPSIETGSGTTPVRNLAVNFHSSHMPVVATGCTGPLSCESGQTLLGEETVCDVGNGACRPGTSKTPVDPSQVALDPTKRYYISVLPGDASNDTEAGEAAHGMGGASISSAQVTAGTATTIDVDVQPYPFPTAKLSIYVFEDDYPLNGESDTGGGVDVLAPNEPGLGSFNIVLFDQTGQFGDPAGQLTYDEFNEPVSNALAGKIDPLTGFNACPISATSADGIVGQIVTCPTYEATLDGVTTTVLSPLAGHAIVENMYPGMYEVHATPGAERIARGEEWLQTNTLDGTKEIEAFLKPGEPSYFQEFGPGGFHVAVGFANPAVIKARKGAVCANQTCAATIYGKVTGLRMSRTPDQRVYSSGSYDAYSFGQCYVSLGAPDGADFDFAKCNPDGTFQFTGLPQGNMKVTVFDQWNDLLVDGLSTPIKVTGGSVGTADAPIEIAVTQWRTNLYGRIFIDRNQDGVSQDDEPGLPLVPYNIRYRDGSYCCFNNTDLAGNAGFNEVFPYLNWLVIDTDSARYKQTGVHVVYDAGGPADGTAGGADSAIAAGLANTIEQNGVPENLRVPGARYCASADCPAGDTAGGSTGRVDPGWVPSEGWQGLLGNNSFVEFAMQLFAPGENGGIKGHVIYTTTRPFDDPALSLQLSWEPGVPNVKLNLYQQGVAPDGTKTLKLVDTTTTTSWDDWAQGFRRDANGDLVLDVDGRAIPNMSCPGQDDTSPFYFTMENSTQALNPDTSIAANGRYKCYDGWSMLNQVQPAPYNGLYKFPSVVAKSGTSGFLPGPGEAMYLELDPTSHKTNCTICTPSPDGTPMLPAGKYVVEVVLPDGYELVKEEDKNILLGDVYIAPAEQQFAGFGNIFILPDQASVNAYYNSYNALQSTTNNNATPRHEGDTGSVEVFWPCVGAARIVPDLNSLFPGAGQAAPFAGATRRLCDRKEVTLEDQTTALAKFYTFTSAHVAGHFTGTITNDFASEFDPFSPQFGEKFAVPNSPVAIRDFSGKEISRVYADQWGLFNGLTFSSWSVNPPSPSGYIPNMMITCMNDPGPIKDTNPDSPTFGQMITDPAYNPAYSNFCYEIPFMPGETAYLDTPVIPTMAFADGYNLPDCEYPDTTPAISTVLGSTIDSNAAHRGPWVSASGQPLTINALGDKPVINHAYSGPNATAAPYNQKFITRHYGFGDRPATCPSSGACPNATIGGVAMTNVTTWTDSQIVGNVPTIPATLNTTTGVGSTCSSAATPGAGQTPRQRQVGGLPTTAQTSNYRCGELVITAGNGNKSVDTVTVTVAGKPPTYVAEGSSLQAAIDSATSGDLLIVGPGTFRENLLMWKPVRLQGVGATSVTINADAHPAGKMDEWRRRVVCYFGLTLDGRPADGPYAGCPASQFMKVDRNNREGILGWDATLNGNLGQLLQEPTLMGAYEGAGITVLGKGVSFPINEDFYAQANAGAFPAGTRYLNGTSTGSGDCRSGAPTNVPGRDYTTSNFLCNPSRIDGVSVINSSQGGGGIFLHGWNHQTEIANNRVYANHGTLTGGITVGSGEFTVPYIVGGVDPIFFPTPGLLPGQQAGYGMNTDVRVHHNSVTANASIGDALYSGTNSAAGGVTFCTGADRYRFNNNWVCGNLTTGDGGGVVHSGFINDGVIAHNQILFNQSQSPTIPTNGGGLAVLGASPDRTLTSGPNAGQECGTTSDIDCPPGLPEGTGRNLLIDANLIMGNSAESGTGGGLRLQLVNGDDVVAFPLLSGRWNDVTITNNIIANNVAGWDGAGVSLQDALRVRFVNNTVISNDTTASAGVLFNTLGAPMASVPPPGCIPDPDPENPDPNNHTCDNPVPTSVNQVAGLVTMRNTPNMDAALGALPLGGIVICPAGNSSGIGATLPTINGDCRRMSYPNLRNNVFWHNRPFHIAVGDVGTGMENQQAVVTLVPSLNQTSTGFCAPFGTTIENVEGSGGPVNYWDIGVRGDNAPSNHGSGFTLEPRFSILTNASDYTGPAGSYNNIGSDPAVLRLYCNGSRLPPENGGHGYQAPPGRSETTGLYPVFALNQITPAATVDEGNNWISLGYGPLSLVNPNDGHTVLGDYRITAGSPAFNSASSTLAPSTDFFGTSRPQAGAFDRGAVEVIVPPIASVSPTSLAFGTWATGTSSPARTLTLVNATGANLMGIGVVVTAPFVRPTGTAGGTCGTTLTTGTGSCTINIVFSPTAVGSATGSVTITSNAPVVGSPVSLSGTAVATRATVSITPNPLLITLPSGSATGTGTVTLTNTAPAAGANMSVSGVNVTGGTILTFFFNGVAGEDSCTGATLQPGQTCTVGVRFTNVLSARGTTRTGSITFTDNAQPPTSGTGSQSGVLQGIATP